MKKFMLFLLVILLALVSVSGIAFASSAPQNVLRADDDDDCESGNNYIAMGGPYLRNQYLSISFLDSLEDMPSDAWDVSAAGDGSVMAWAVPNGDYYDMYIAGEGGVTANENCDGLFRAYTNLTDFYFNGNFDTSNTRVMDSMFSCLFDLEILDLRDLDTSNVTSTYFMFSTSDRLKLLRLGKFDTSNVTDFSFMFYNCSSLTELDLSGFDTGKAERMKGMFEGCEALQTLETGSGFAVPEGCNTEDMFKDCNLLSSSVTSRYTAAKPKATAKPTSKPQLKIEIKKQYSNLYFGDEGPEVTQLQNRLIYLGYLANGQADGDYGKKTATAVHLFKQQNGIYDGACGDGSQCTATAEMQEMLFSGGAMIYTEPEFCLRFPDNSYMNWQNVSGNKLKLRVEVENFSRTRTISAFELRAYATDVWGDCIYGEGYYYYDTTKKSIAPGTIAKSDYLVIPNRSDICEIRVGISKIIYSDGEVEEAYPVDYWYWTYTG